MIDSVRQRWNQWLINKHPKQQHHIIHQQKLYIMPSRFGWFFALALLGLFIGAINYQVSTVFLLCFVLGISAMLSAWSAHQNLQGIKVQCLEPQDCASGDVLKLRIQVETDKTMRFDLHFSLRDFPNHAYLHHLKEPGVVELEILSDKRGIYAVPFVKIASRYPLGLFTVWTWLGFNQEYVVYPKPIDPGYWPQTSSIELGKLLSKQEEDELQELRQIDNPSTHRNRIAWKIAAKGQGWFYKILETEQNEQWIFRLQDIPGSHLEVKLQYLSFWLLNAERNGMEYALQMSDEPYQLHRGLPHLRKYLKTLANYAQ